MVRGSGRLPCVVVTGVNPAEDAGDTPPNILVGGTSTGISLQYYYVLSDIADQYWLPSVRSASSRFHSAIRRHQFASVRKADSRLTRLVPPALNWSSWKLSLRPMSPVFGPKPAPRSSARSPLIDLRQVFALCARRIKTYARCRHPSVVGDVYDI